MNMVQIVAQAICSEWWGETRYDEHWGRERHPLDNHPGQHERYRLKSLEQAREAIEALRPVPDVCYDSYRCDKLWRDMNSKEVWNLWIEAALADDKAEKAA